MVKRWVHQAIVAYLKRCGGTFHSGEYGEQGRYVALMTEQQYHYYTVLARSTTADEFFSIVWAAREAGVQVA